MNDRKKKPAAEKVRDAFVEYITKNEKRPRSLSEFCETQQLTLEDVKAHYKSLITLEKAVWLHWFEETLQVLRESEEYKGYGARERLLSFYYTWMDTIKPVRGYIKSAPTLPKLFSGVDLFLGDTERAFSKYAKELVHIAAANEEIMKRFFIQNYYDKALWQQFLFILNFWIKDESEEQSKTDEAIERSVSLLAELAGRNQVDSIIDFGKFLFKSK